MELTAIMSCSRFSVAVWRMQPKALNVMTLFSFDSNVANLVIASTGVPQIFVAHSGVFGTPSYSPLT